MSDLSLAITELNKGINNLGALPMKRSLNENLALARRHLRNRSIKLSTEDLFDSIKMGIERLLAMPNCPVTLSSVATALAQMRPSDLSADAFEEAVAQVLKSEFHWVGTGRSIGPSSKWNIGHNNGNEALPYDLKAEGHQAMMSLNRAQAVTDELMGIRLSASDDFMADSDRRYAQIADDLARRGGDQPKGIGDQNKEDSMLTEAEARRLKSLIDRADAIHPRCNWKLKVRLWPMRNDCWRFWDQKLCPPKSLWSEFEGTIEACERSGKALAV